MQSYLWKCSYLNPFDHRSSFLHKIAVLLGHQIYHPGLFSSNLESSSASEFATVGPSLLLLLDLAVLTGRIIEDYLKRITGWSITTTFLKFIVF